ncbi:ubiquinone biosynthesis O-methyltransferase, mitochondrial [Adelges cooleyi]|uniref:ubiquinone biosynthesis O-methyltransferase, mitochondrial n=1 Tax=Adelges cooleyi TaxID=133065 RepID=UPI00217F7363|nr:ubiquinone biosynthesis O-methyltransferase, mitochondrial [Adelges cooleyi]
MIILTKKSRITASINIIRNLIHSNAETVNDYEVDHHSNMKEYWWEKTGPLKALHSLNPLRVSFLINGLSNTKSIHSSNINTRNSLKNLKILDVGCGGGILTEALARLEGSVTGIDPSKELIEIAKSHSVFLKNKHLTYLNEPIEDHVKSNEGKYDAVITSEVIEHISNKQTFLTNCVECLKPGGSIFLTTPNKTFASWLGVVVLAEHLGFIPKGTHQWEKFIRPHELQSILEIGCKCDTITINGLSYNPLTNNWSWSDSTDISYALHAVKYV